MWMCSNDLYGDCQSQFEKSRNSEKHTDKGEKFKRKVINQGAITFIAFVGLCAGDRQRNRRKKHTILCNKWCVHANLLHFGFGASTYRHHCCCCCYSCACVWVLCVLVNFLTHFNWSSRTNAFKLIAQIYISSTTNSRSDIEKQKQKKTKQAINKKKKASILCTLAMPLPLHRRILKHLCFWWVREMCYLCIETEINH